MSADAFIVTFKGFISRRGHPVLMCSDNVTNFIGTSNHIKRLHETIAGGQMQRNLFNMGLLAWKFTPPNAPNVGGLWEAAIKSFKYVSFFKSVTGFAKLDIEFLLTLLATIETCLNSGPLTVLSSDTNDFEHLPKPDLHSIPFNRLRIFQRIEFVAQHFWRRWHVEYVTSLNPRQR